LASLVVVLAAGALAAACAPAPSPPPPPPTAGCRGPAGPPDAVTQRIFDRVNSDRAANGLGGLSWNPQLACLATDWSTQLGTSGTFRHRDLNAVIRSPDYAGYRTLGENILRGPASLTGDQMEDSWMNSPGHRANLLSGAFTSIGIGLYYTPDGAQVYATQNFGG
jgi:uncharacterized protein YkwD